MTEILFLGMEAEKSDARGIMVLRSGKLMVLGQKLDLRGNQHTWKTLDFGGGVNEGAPKIDFGTTYFLCNR